MGRKTWRSVRRAPVLPVCAVCVALLVVLASCQSTEKKERARLTHAGLVIGIELVRENVDLDSLSGLNAKASVPKGILSAEYEILQAVRGREYGAVVAERRNGQRPAVGVWLFDPTWRRIGQVKGLPLGERNGSVLLAWDRAGRRLGVLLWVPSVRVPSMSATVLGLVELPRLAFTQILILDRATWPQMVWAGNTILVSCSIDNQNLVLRVDPATGHMQRLYAEDRHLPRLSAIQDVKLSPDGRYLAFSVLDLTPRGPAQMGIYLLDLAAGKRVRLTSEAGASSYVHNVVRWEDDARLLFVRKINPSRWDLYRAVLALPRGHDTALRPALLLVVPGLSV